MTQVRASRFNQPYRRKSGFWSNKFPYGSIQRKIILRIALPMVILIIFYLLANEVVMPAITRHGAEFPLPDFVNQRIIDVQVTLKDLNLKYEISSEEFSPGKEKGVILKQFPNPDTKVKPERVIKFVTSLGKKLVPIPNLAGLSVRQAILNLETAGLELGEIAWAFSDTLPEKVVVFSYPAAETEIPLGSPVNLMVNHGRASNFTYMPYVVGLTLDEAAKRLEDKALNIGIVTYRTDENYLPETVLEQSESNGTELDIGTEIDLVVSSTE